MSKLYLICVGKLKDKHLIALETEYLKRITSPKLTIIECKSFDENKEKEAQEVLKKYHSIPGSPQMTLMTEKGQLMNSPQLSSWIHNKLERPHVFVIAGASGPSLDLIQKADSQLSLSLLTFPHQMARIILAEQIYRAQTIKKCHPYHK